MSPIPAVVDIDALGRLEADCRERLRLAPDDVRVRADLAWCLFAQAVHTAGEERLLKMLGDEAGQRPRRGNRSGSLADRDAEDILHECLYQAATVSQLCPQTEGQSEILRLQSLVQSSGGSEAVAQAEDQARRILASIARDMLAEETDPGGDASAPRLRRGHLRAHRFR